MIIRYFKTRKSWASLVQESFRKSLESYLEFLNIAEQRAVEISPDHELAWQNAFRFQRLVKRRQVLRFEYLLSNNMFDAETFKSVAGIEERVERGWGEMEETALRTIMPAYSDIAREIKAIESNADPHALDGARLLLEKDREYRIARQVLAEKAQKRQLRRGQ